MDTILPSSKHQPANSVRISVAGIFSTVLSVGAVLWSFGAVTGVATAQTSQPAATVTYADLDLSTQSGAQTLLKRIDDAALGICGPTPVHSSLTPTANTLHQRCLTEAVDGAVARIGAPLLTALHTGTAQPASTTFAAR
jgi:UrcA family protein